MAVAKRARHSQDAFMEAAGQLAGLEAPQISLVTYLDLPSANVLLTTSKDGLFVPAVAADKFQEHWMSKVFGVGGQRGTTGPCGEAAEHRRAALKQWYLAAKDIGAEHIFARPIARPFCGAYLGAWARLHRAVSGFGGGRVLETLRPPATGDAFAALDAYCTDKGIASGAHPLVSGLWSVHDGQAVPHMMYDQLGLDVPQAEPEMGLWNVLFGGYSVYDHVVCMMFLPLKVAIALTRRLQEMVSSRGNQETHPTKIIFAFSQMKRMYVDLVDGSVSCGTASFDFFPAAPAGDGHDGLVRWFDEYTRRLEDGTYAYRTIVTSEPDSVGINLFPTKGPDMSRCVTKGVEVSAAPIYMPEHQTRGWGYNISMRLVGTAEERGFQSCQLTKRIWDIQMEGSPPSKVEGDGVIGFFPILKDGGWECNRSSDPNMQYDVVDGRRTRTSSHFIEGEFRYQSCTNGSRRMKGQFAGSLLMVPGTTAKPTGQPFNVALEPFQLRVPEFIF